MELQGLRQQRLAQGEGGREVSSEGGTGETLTLEAWFSRTPKPEAQFPRRGLLGRSCINALPTIIFPVLSFFLAVLALSLPLCVPWLDPRLPWLDPRLPWLALRLPWPVVLCCALRRARLVYGKAPQAHQKVRLACG